MNPPDRQPDGNQPRRPGVGRNLFSGPFLWIILLTLAVVMIFEGPHSRRNAR